MRESSRKLEEELIAWRRWATTASRDENGWESDAPNWTHLMKQAQEVLVEAELQPDEISRLEVVFSLSEEDELLADFLKANYESVPKDTIRRLLVSRHSSVRWQVYDSLVIPDDFSRTLLMQGIQDPDNYVRRRAFLRLLSSGTPPMAVLQRAANDPDSVIREHAKTMLM